VWLEVEGRFVIGDGGLLLLSGVDEYGSLLQASRAMGWSYRHAWGYLRNAEAALGSPLTVTRPGKGTSRGMALTETGRTIVAGLAEARRRIDGAVGPGGPTPDDIAARGRSAPGEPGTTRRRDGGAGARSPRYRDGDWRSLG
jgi:molybdate transport system regulatory protein